jgi:hypothetical protein
MIQYIPKKYVDMPKLAEQPFVSAWKGHDRILHDLVERFQIPCHTALEFGVQWGYSTSVLANVFEKVIGIDTFQGDKHSGVHGLCFSDTARRLQSWSNIQLCQQTYQDRIALDKEQYDLIHIDIVHTYEDTLALGLWATAHAKLVIFHDTESYPEVKRAVNDIAKQTGREFYNYEPHCGLGILAPRIPVDSKVLIGFITAHHASRNPHVAAQRIRMANSPFDYKFVYGSASSQKEAIPFRSSLSDELFFECDDTKPFMVLKDKALFQWALDHGYEYVFRACDDTVVYPERLLQHLDYLKKHDYAGTMCGYGAMAGTGAVFTLRYLDYMHGGVGVWLSRKAMEMLIADDWKGPYSSPYSNQIELTPGTYFKGSWGIYWDDLWMGEVLKGNLNYNDPRRNNIYGNYLVYVYDDPSLFASNKPFDSDKVISTHSIEQMGMSDVKPLGFSTLDNKMTLLSVDWSKTSSEFHAVTP